MDFDDEKWRKPVDAGTLGGVALDIAMAITSVNSALSKISAAYPDADLSSDIERLNEIHARAWEKFIDYTGYQVNEK